MTKWYEPHAFSKQRVKEREVEFTPNCSDIGPVNDSYFVETYGRHAISGGEYTTIEGITYSIAPQGPNCLKYRDKIHPDSPYPDWYRHYPMRRVENYGL